MRECWSASQPVAVGAGSDADAVPTPIRPAVRASAGRTFVPVDEVERARDAEPPAATTPAAAAHTASARDGWSLWGDAEA